MDVAFASSFDVCGAFWVISLNTFISFFDRLIPSPRALYTFFKVVYKYFRFFIWCARCGFRIIISVIVCYTPFYGVL